MAKDTEKHHRFEVTQSELADLIETCNAVRLDFGPGWAAVTREKGTPMPDYVERLGLIRGVLNENMDGAGI